MVEWKWKENIKCWNGNERKILNGGMVMKGKY
jgi:hypothetical protein